MSNEELTLGPLTREEAKVFIRALEKKCNKTMKVLNVKERISYHIHSMDEALGRYTYNQVTNKEIVGRIVIARGIKGEARVVQEFAVTRQKLHADLNVGKRLSVPMNEKRWSNR